MLLVTIPNTLWLLGHVTSRDFSPPPPSPLSLPISGLETSNPCLTSDSWPLCSSSITEVYLEVNMGLWHWQGWVCQVFEGLIDGVTLRSSHCQGEQSCYLTPICSGPTNPTILTRNLLISLCNVSYLCKRYSVHTWKLKNGVVPWTLAPAYPYLSCCQFISTVKTGCLCFIQQVKVCLFKPCPLPCPVLGIYF